MAMRTITKALFVAFSVVKVIGADGLYSGCVASCATQVDPDGKVDKECASSDYSCVCKKTESVTKLACCMAYSCSGMNEGLALLAIRATCGQYNDDLPTTLDCPQDESDARTLQPTTTATNGAAPSPTASIDDALPSDLFNFGGNNGDSSGDDDSGDDNGDGSSGDSGGSSSSASSSSDSGGGGDKKGSDNHLAIGLGVGLGLGLPLTLAIAGVLGFCVWRTRRNGKLDAAETEATTTERTTMSPPPSISSPIPTVSSPAPRYSAHYMDYRPTPVPNPLGIKPEMTGSDPIERYELPADSYPSSRFA